MKRMPRYPLSISIPIMTRPMLLNSAIIRPWHSPKKRTLHKAGGIRKPPGEGQEYSQGFATLTPGYYLPPLRGWTLMNMQNRADESIDKNQQPRRNGRTCSSLTARGGVFLQPNQLRSSYDFYDLVPGSNRDNRHSF